MSKPLIICISAKKRGGKNAAANFIGGTYLLKTRRITHFKLNQFGLLHCNTNSHEFMLKEGEFNKIFSDSGVKIYSFADPLKEFCMDVFGLTNEQCYGNEEQKNSLTQLRWEDMPTDNYYEDKPVIRYGANSVVYSDPPRQKKGLMTARQLLQYFGTDIVRTIFGNAWVNATINKINREKPKLAIISDARFKNEIEGINDIGGKTIRLLRDVCEKDSHESEGALDNFPLDKYSLVINNQEISIEQQSIALMPHVEQWFKEI